MNDEDKINKIRIVFDIELPRTAIDSDFNSLIFRLRNIRDILSVNKLDPFYIEENNRNIQEMQNTLEHFIIKEYSNHANTM